MGKSARRHLILIFILTLVSRCSVAAEGWSLPLFTSDPKAVLEAAAKIPAPGGASALVLDASITSHIDSDGRTRVVVRTIHRVLTQAGVQQLSTFTAPWASWRQARPKFRVRVITDDGLAHMLDESIVRETGVPAQLVQGIFSDLKILNAPLPGILPNSIVETEIETQDSQVVFPGGPFLQYRFAQAIPTSHLRVAVEAPAKTNLRVVIRGLENAHRQESRQGEWQQILIEAVDVPAPQARILMPPEASSVPEIAVSTGATWEGLAKWYSEIVDQQAGVALPKAETVEPAAARLARVEAILAEIQKAVRYTGLELGMSAYIPRKPEETLSRGYGDCKDKAVLLISRLRKAGIPASLALLSPHPAPDVLPDLPGLEAFTHAIVYIPGDKPLWVDPSSQYTPASRLPGQDQARLALIVDPSTTRLIRTPESQASDNRSTELLEVELQANGPAKFKRTQEDLGAFDDQTRRALQMVAAGTDKLREALRNAMALQSNVKRVVEFDLGSPEDLTKPARIRLAGEEYGYAATKDQTAWAYVSELGLGAGPMAALVQEFGAGTTSTGRSKRTEDYCFPFPFTLERRTVITPPSGFAAKQAPPLGTLSVGPLELTRSAAIQRDGSVQILYRLVNTKTRFAVSEAKAIGEELRRLSAASFVRVEFTRNSQQLVSQGKLKEALALLRRDAAATPPNSAALVRLSSALLEAGATAQAVELCKTAIAADPRSAGAYAALAEAYTRDPVGRPFKPGMNPSEAEKALLRAIELNPADKGLVLKLAQLYVYDEEGHVFMPRSRLGDAIVRLQEISADISRPGFPPLIPEALLYARRYEDAEKYFQQNPSITGNPDIRLAMTAVRGETAKTIRDAETLVPDEHNRRIALTAAGWRLVSLREYAKGADLIEAGERGSGNVTPQSELELLRRARKHEDVQLSGNPVIAVVQKLICALLDTQNEEIWRSLPASERRDEQRASTERIELLRLLGAYRTVAHEQLSGLALADVAVSNITFTTVGSDRLGYRVRFANPAPNGAVRMVAVVVKRGEEYSVQRLSGTPAALGEQALALVEKGDLASARQWLDWAREEMTSPVPSGGDPLAGLAFSKLWPTEKADAPDQLKAAAASLAARGPGFETAIRTLRQIRGESTDGSFRLYLDLAVLQGLMAKGRRLEALEEVTRLHKLRPESEYGSQMFAEASILDGRAGEALEIARGMLQKDPLSTTWLRMAAQAYRVDRRYKESADTYRKLCATPRALPFDWSGLAFVLLFMPGEEQSALEAATTANRLAQQRTPFSLPALAAAQAELGNTDEARQTILRYLDLTGSVDDAARYVFGRIVEQLDLPEAAAEHYGKVKKSESEMVPFYELAQRRLEAMREARSGL
jgi:tetratricopeptide (TPR) repeat protein